MLCHCNCSDCSLLPNPNASESALKVPRSRDTTHLAHIPSASRNINIPRKPFPRLLEALLAQEEPASSHLWRRPIRHGVVAERRARLDCLEQAEEVKISACAVYLRIGGGNEGTNPAVRVTSGGVLEMDGANVHPGEFGEEGCSHVTYFTGRDLPLRPFYEIGKKGKIRSLPVREGRRLASIGPPSHLVSRSEDTTYEFRNGLGKFLGPGVDRRERGCGHGQRAAEGVGEENRATCGCYQGA